MKGFGNALIMIAEGEIEQAIKTFIDLMAGENDIVKDSIHLSSRYKSLEKSVERGTINENEAIVERNKITSTLIKLIQNTQNSLKVFSIDFEEIDEKDALKRIDFRQVKNIYILGHTGKNLFKLLYDRLEREAFTFKPKIYLLLRNPLSENQRRYGQIRDSVIDQVESFNYRGIREIEIRFYENKPQDRLIVCELNNDNEERISFISEYEDVPQYKTRAWGYGCIVGDNKTSKNKYLEKKMNTFRHLWGKKEIHTLVFDFDDTIVETTKLQIEAWDYTIRHIFDKKEINPNYFSMKVLNLLKNNKNLDDLLKDIFLKFQMADKIGEEIFPNIPQREKQELVNFINGIRFNRREKLTLEKALLFPGAKEKLITLSKDYQFGMISSTSEILIKKVLNRLELLELFPDIFGKIGPKFDWENIESKSQKLINLSRKIGTPLNRMVMIGDNHTDYLSARQLNMNFIEANMIASKYGIGSLITYKNLETKFKFESYETDELDTILNQINDDLRIKKLGLPKEYLM